MGKRDAKIQYQNAKDAVVIEDGKDGDEKATESCVGQMQRMPKQTWPILITELCERFSYYGIKTVLVLYLTQDLMYEKYRAKSIYHAFSMVSYFTGVLGAMMADSFLGKFRTIVLSLLVYSISEIALTITCVPSIGRTFKVGPLISLFLTAIACGNIKPCLAAFGGDQFDQKDTTLIGKFFSMFYMAVNVGATFTMIFTPMIRTDVKCFGGDCYPAAFGVPTLFMVIATVSFLIASSWYVKKKPEGNMMLRVINIICYAIKQGSENRSKGIKYDHWLEHAQDSYSMDEINDVKALLKVLKMYIPLPVFWALFHQQGSSWTLQAEQMDGDLGSLGTLRSDQIQFFNPVLVLILIPFFDGLVYPIFERCRCGLTPLKKMTGGLILTAIAFAVCGFVQIKIQTVNSPPTAPTGSQTSVEFINAAPCSKVMIEPDSFFKIELGFAQRSSFISGEAGTYKTFQVKMDGCSFRSRNFTGRFTVRFNQTYQTVIIYSNGTSVEAKRLDRDFGKADVTTANSRIRIIYSPVSITPNLNVQLEHVIEEKKNKQFSVKPQEETIDNAILADEYTASATMHNTTMKVDLELSNKYMKLGTFGAYTLVISQQMGTTDPKKLYGKFYEDIKSTSVHRIWQLPQYVVITAGEVMFSVTGLEFAYSQAPHSMKSVLQACWLLTVAFGDLLVVIFSEAKPVTGVEKEMFLYGGFMGIVAIIFGIMCTFYTYSDFSGREKEEPLDDKAILGENGITPSSSTTTL
ncbi:solute carrier family 15 member 1-like isoform X1 [Rhopilema esculentum]|uniref:solute carrier family 15 member 1-like isoform X1 n=1 Tax=Rhopilema esculentum TaxID=499914 RepID=UPI0031D03CB0